MKGFAAYARELEALVSRAQANIKDLKYHEHIAAALDGQPARKIRESIPLEALRSAGAFFTSEKLAKDLTRTIQLQLADSPVIADPGCGAGDLLTACALHLPIQESLEETLESWGELFWGADIHEEFIRVTKARLTLVALKRGAQVRSEMPDLKLAFPHISCGDAFEQISLISEAHCILLNPPFTMTIAPRDCSWATGKVSTAALFLEASVLNARPGTKILAILPDVLRTGSHYLRFRKHIEQNAKVESVEIVGLFDVWTDVDVFILRLVVGENSVEPSEDWWRSANTVEISSTSLSDLFDIHIGPVVPHRDPQLGQWYPYIHARDLPAWETVDVESFPRRRFLGTTYVPPFVVVRRTSRPGDKNRTVATVIKGKRAVAVENHLVVLKPKSGSMQRCVDSLIKLRSNETNEWLNERIRCRHLTVSSIGEIPWWK